MSRFGGRGEASVVPRSVGKPALVMEEQNELENIRMSRTRSEQRPAKVVSRGEG